VRLLSPLDRTRLEKLHDEVAHHRVDEWVVEELGGAAEMRVEISLKKARQSCRAFLSSECCAGFKLFLTVYFNARGSNGLPFNVNWPPLNANLLVIMPSFCVA
jgi:hypothetical protein